MPYSVFQHRSKGQQHLPQRGKSDLGLPTFGDPLLNGLGRDPVNAHMLDLGKVFQVAASTGWWQSYQEDGVYIYLNNSLIVSFRPNSSRNLQSPNFPTYLN